MFDIMTLQGERLLGGGRLLERGVYSRKCGNLLIKYRLNVD